jgi:uncharacterized protein (TIGR02217 family)
MAVLEARIATGVRRGSSGGPATKRNKVYDAAGRLKGQQFLRTKPLHKYRFDFGTKLLDDADAIRNFFYVVMFSDPPYEGFRVRDWNDYQLDQSKSSLTLITGAIYQINRVYTAGPASVLRPVYRTEAGTETIYRTRSGVVTVASAVVDPNTAQATISGHASGDTYTCDANFDIAVTFSDDEALAGISLDGNVENILQALGIVELEELPPP